MLLWPDPHCLSLVLYGFGVYVGILALDVCIFESRGENVILILIGLIIGLGFIILYGIRFIQELFGNGDSKTGYPDTYPPEDDGED